MLETPSQLVWRHLKRAINATRLSWPSYAIEVREHYERITPPDRRLIQFSVTADAYTRARNDAQTIRRFDYDNDHRYWDYDIPADLQPAMILALGSTGYAHYGELLAELAATYGLIAAAMPQDGVCGDACTVADVLRRTADLMQSTAPLLEDRTIDDRDAPEQLGAARTQARAAMAALASLEARLGAAIAKQQRATGGRPVRAVK